jgi:hypothetical protein
LGHAGSSNTVRDTEPPENLHGPRVATLHFRQKLRFRLLLDEQTLYAAHAEVDCERESYRSGSNDDDLSFHIRPPFCISHLPDRPSLRRVVIRTTNYFEDHLINL